MKTMLAFTLLCLLPPAVHAGDLISIPSAVFCKVPINGNSAFKTLANMFLPPAETRAARQAGLNTLIGRLGAKVRAEHVQPAMDTACARKQLSGVTFIEEAKSACQTGCPYVADKFGGVVDATEQKALQAQCEAGCDVGEAGLYGWAFGVAAGLDYKK